MDKHKVMKYVKTFESFVDQVNEELLGAIQRWGQEPVDIYKNPKMIKRMPAGLRAISDKDGNLYVMDYGGFRTFIHSDLADWLKENGYIKHSGDDLYDQLDKYITWQRHEATNEFRLGESMKWAIEKSKDPSKAREGAAKIFKKVQKRNPQFKFIDTHIWGDGIEPIIEVK